MFGFKKKKTKLVIDEEMIQEMCEFFNRNNEYKYHIESVTYGEYVRCYEKEEDLWKKSAALYFKRDIFLHKFLEIYTLDKHHFVWLLKDKILVSIQEKERKLRLKDIKRAANLYIGE